jgi:hypothetical protein
MFEQHSGAIEAFDLFSNLDQLLLEREPLRVVQFGERKYVPTRNNEQPTFDKSPERRDG